MRVFEKLPVLPWTLSFFLKSTRPSLPLKKAPHLSPSLSLLRRERMCQPPYSVLKPLRYKVGGPSEVYASSRAAFFCAGMNPPCGRACESKLSLRSFAQPFPSGYRGCTKRTGLILIFKNLHKTFGK